MIKVNLVPGEILAKARQRLLALQLSLGGGVLALVVVMISIVHWLNYRAMENDYSLQQSTLNTLSAVVAQVDELEKANEAVRARLGVIESLLKGRAFYPLFMSEFAQTVPAGVRVMSVNTLSQSNSSLKLAINATANSSDDVAGWMRTLEKNAHFASVELGPVNASGAQYVFSISTVYSLKL